MNLLVCEDDSSVGDLLQRGLSRKGYAVTWVQRGEDAFKAMKTGAFDLMILDLSLPDIDGLRICRSLRQKGNDIPILMLTARDALENKVAGFKTGADDYLTKPFAFSELDLRIQALLRRTHPSAQSATLLVKEELVINTSKRQAAYKEKVLDLTEREFQLLSCLFEQLNNVVPRERIIQRVWGARAQVTDNTVDVYIGYLRKKMELYTGEKCIHTVRGQGFKLILPKAGP